MNMTEPEKSEKQSNLRNIEFAVDGERLSGLLFEVDKKGPKVLILGGGAGIPVSEGYYPAWQKVMAEGGINSLSFDFRGIGASGGDIKETSLNSRLQDARTATETLNGNLPEGKLFIAGVSMGAPIAVRLANEVNADGVILISPAAYSQEARSAQYGEQFSEAIQEENSWKDSPDFKELEKFGGKILLAYGEQDDVIPQAILRKYERIAKGCGPILKFEQAGHRFMREQDPPSQSARRFLNKEIVELVNQ